MELRVKVAGKPKELEESTLVVTTSHRLLEGLEHYFIKKFSIVDLEAIYK